MAIVRGIRGSSIVFAALVLSAEARADPTVELSGASGFGALVAGVGPARFAMSPSASVSVLARLRGRLDHGQRGARVERPLGALLRGADLPL